MNFDVGKKFYNLSKFGGGGEVIWTKSKRTAVFCQFLPIAKVGKTCLCYYFASGHASTVFFAFCCENWHIRWMNRHPVCRLKGWGKTCFLMVFHAILRQILIFCFCAISYCLVDLFRKGGRGHTPICQLFPAKKKFFLVIGFWTFT